MCATSPPWRLFGSRAALSGICESKNDTRIFHIRVRIRSDINSSAVRANRRIPKSILRLEIARKMTSSRLPVGAKRQHVKRTALERGHQENFVPTWNPLTFGFVVLDARGADRRPANGVGGRRLYRFDSLARRVLKIVAGRNREHGGDRIYKRFLEHRLGFLRHR